MTYCIYQISDGESKKRYVGMTMHPDKRKARHFKELEANTHHNMQLQSGYDSGVGFQFKIIDWFQSFDEGRNEEIRLMRDDVKSGNSYNIEVGHDTCTNHPRREQIIAKRVAAQKDANSKLSVADREKRFVKRGDKNNNWRGGTSKKYCECGSRMALTAATCSKCQDKSGDKNPFFGKKHTKETISKLSAISKKRYDEGFRPTNSLKCEVDGVEYESYNHASRELGSPVVTIRYRCLSENPKFKRWIVYDK